MRGDKLFGLIRNHFLMKGRTNISEIQSRAKSTQFPPPLTVPACLPALFRILCIKMQLSTPPCWKVLCRFDP